MSRQPPSGGDATWKGIAIIVGAVVIGLLVFRSFGGTPRTTVATQGPDQPKGATTTTARSGSTLPTTTSSIPLKDNATVKVLVANATETSGATKKVIDALKPACYAVAPNGVDAVAKVKQEKRKTSTVYSTPGFEREANLITSKLGLPAAANAALPPESPIPTKGQPSFNVLVLVASDLVDRPPEPLPGAECGSTSTTRAGSAGTSRATTTTTRRTTTTAGARNTTTTKAITTTSQKPTTTGP